MSDQAVYPSAESVGNARLLDGRVVSMRQLGVGDADEVYALHRHLSDHDRYFRFFTLQPVGLHELAGTLTEPPEGACAVGAFDAGRLIGVAHYTVDDTDDTDDTDATDATDADAAVADAAVPAAQDAAPAAEVAVVVAHEEHSLGVGTALLKYLGHIARTRGIDRFVADVLGENHLMLTVFYDLGWPCEPQGDGSVRHLTIQLPDTI